MFALLLREEVGSFSFAAIHQAIKNPARGGASENSVERSITTIAATYLASIRGCSKSERPGSRSSASSFVVSKFSENGNFSIAAAVPTVIPRIKKQEIISTGWMS